MAHIVNVCTAQASVLASFAFVSQNDRYASASVNSAPARTGSLSSSIIDAQAIVFYSSPRSIAAKIFWVRGFSDNCPRCPI